MYLGDYINGKFDKCEDKNEHFEVKSPSDHNDIIGSVDVKFANVDKAVDAASKAFKTWSRLELTERVQYLKKLSEIFLSRKEDFAKIISRETGKPLWESRTEAGAICGKINITIEHSMKLVDDEKIENALPGVDGVIRYRPKGVMSVIGPFNFPAHLPNGHMVPALLTGNTIVFKPSDKTPFTGQLMAECYEEAGFPEGVFNLVQGQVETGKRLVSHRDVDGVLFTGSYDVGLKIKQDTITHYWKTLALEMGGKNTSVIWEDANLEKAVFESLMGGFLSAGQRCSCTSIMFVHENIYDQFLDKFYEAAKKIKIGHWSEEDAFMGPLISEESVEKYITFQQIAVREGAECIMRGKKLETEKPGNYVSPSIYAVKEYSADSTYLTQEIFGPNVAVIKVSDLDKTLDAINSSHFGLVSSIFTQSKELYEKAYKTLNVGLLNWNRTTNGASSRLPFGGTKKSGNGHPSAHHAVYYCTTPVASLEDYTTYEDIKLPPGLEL
ncbi:MAG: succinylglutamate-semialdehyde dehydrogenase [Bdellovibrionales bacterium]